MNLQLNPRDLEISVARAVRLGEDARAGSSPARRAHV